MPDPKAVRNGEVRAGSIVLLLLGNPLNVRVLRALVGASLRLAKLQERVGWAAQTTLRAAVANLGAVGAVEKRLVGGTHPLVEIKLTPAGEEMLFVADVLERWLVQAPSGPIDPGSDAAKAAVKALVGGWTSSAIRTLASRQLTLAELDAAIPGISYPSLERRLVAMRSAGLVEAVDGEGRGRPYAVAEWLRRAIAPLGAAARFELRHLVAESPAIANLEVETGFMLSIPLAPLPPSANGTCLLAVQTAAQEDAEWGLAGVMVEVERGRQVSCAPTVDRSPPTWALGSAEAWLDVVIDGRLETLRIGGARPELALDLANGLHAALFGAAG
jgi:DNA-binding HxlR family transcriptional regulator